MTVYIFRCAEVIELYKELPKLHHLDDCDVISLSAGRDKANRAVIRAEDR